MDLFIPTRELSPLLLPPPAANQGFILTCVLSLALIPYQIHLSHPNAEGPLQQGLTPPKHTTLPFPAAPQSPAQHCPPLSHIPCAQDHHQTPPGGAAGAGSSCIAAVGIAPPRPEQAAEAFCGDEMSTERVAVAQISH